MRINHNIAALNAYRNLEINNENTSKSLEKLSSGLRINRAADDAAGLAISEKMRSQIRGLDMAQRNALDGISVVQTADGALSSTQEILQRMRELAVQAANGSNTDSDRANIQAEINQLTSEVNRIGNSTEFNTKHLLDGSLSISGEPKQIKAGSTAGTLGSAVTLDPNSVLVNGLYNVDITKTSGTPYQNIGTVTDSTGSIPTLNVDAISIANNSDVGLSAGNYQVVLSSQNAKTASNIATTSGTDVLNSAAGNDPITIDANSLLSDGTGYKVEITKSSSYNVTPVSIGGISNLVVDTTTPAGEGKYTIDTKAAVQGSDTTGTLMGSGTLSNITINSTSSYADAGGYQIKVTQVDPDETDGNIGFNFDLVSNNPAPGTIKESVTTSVTSTSGSTQIQLGDISFKLDNAKLWASDSNGAGSVGSFDGNTINLSVKNEISVTQDSTGEVQTVDLADGVASPGQTFTFSDGGKLSFDVDDTSNALTRGTSDTTTVSYDDSWNVQMYETDGTTPRGSSTSLTESDLSDPAKLTNIQVGNAGDGLLLDLDAAKLQTMAASSTSTTDFNVTSGTAITAQVEDMSGNPFGNAIALAGTTAGSIVDLGNNMKLTYDGTTVKTGNVAFSVNDITPDTYQMSLKQDTDNDGVYEKTLVNNVSFNLGDNVALPGSGVKVQTSSGTTVSDNATFEVENGIIDQSAKIQIGANAGQKVSLEINDMRSKSLFISTDVAGGGKQSITMLDGSTQTAWFTTNATANNGLSDSLSEYSLDVTSSDKASAAITVLDNAVQRVSAERARIGAVQNRLEYTVDNLKTMSENVTSSESRIRDVDMALEMTNFTKNNILNQAAQAMLSQANQMPQGVLQLLK